MIENNFGQLGATEDEALAKVEPMIDGILKAQDDIDYDAFCSFFEGGLRTQITKPDFEKNAQNIQQNMGKLKEKQFLTTLNRQGLIALIYKCRFDGSEDDFTITFTINDKSDDLKASGIWIS